MHIMGRENAKNYLKENPLICEEVEAKVRAKYSIDDAAAEEAGAKEKDERLADE